MKIALCTELRNAEWFESRLRSLFAGDGQLVIDELWNEKQLSQALRRSRYHAVVIAMTGARGLEAAIQAKQLAPETPSLPSVNRLIALPASSFAWFVNFGFAARSMR